MCVCFVVDLIVFTIFFLPFFLQNGSEDVKKHKWFKGVIWEDVPLLKLNVRFHVVSNIGKLEMFFLIYD